MSSTTNNNGRSSDGGRTGNRGGRGRGRNTNRNTTMTRNNIIGNEPSLKHHVFDYQEAQPAQKYQENIEALKIYIGKNYHKHTAALMASLNTLELPIPNTLDELQETDAAKTAKMKK